MKFFNRFNNRKILVSPLDWGLGHAARMIPVIKYLSINNNVLTVCGKGAKHFLQKELPDAEIITINDLPIRYPKHRINIFTMLSWLPVLVYNAVREHFFVKRLIKKRGIDTIFSDNRYGLIFKHIECYFITHQIYPKLPHGFSALEKIIGKLHLIYLKRFTQCLVPDFEEGFSLSGSLAGTRMPNNPKFIKIGILSRFWDYKPKNHDKQFDLLILISGQEKQRTIFENQLISQFANSQLRILFVRGVSEEKPPLQNFNNITFKNMLTTEALADAITSSKTIICRSGYSTILDIVALNAQAILIPTPGQTEQEYLAKRLNERDYFYYICPKIKQ